ncbi:hypothetical protein CFP71_28435 [Amycolatopsis thailandensis]|uniref:Serine/threonine protein kinase n=1 Tax=Amycolatopsis thailandensis TaxID=589330 RepID=A0A229RUK1_9PSEU|nr:hypothetical protein [Amycolatopsis thailandensis]OXM50358.1 hypothetical protein CFP71_28435 [Amycolatopsis thailandensis]
MREKIVTLVVVMLAAAVVTTGPAAATKTRAGEYIKMDRIYITDTGGIKFEGSFACADIATKKLLVFRAVQETPTGLAAVFEGRDVDCIRPGYVHTISKELPNLRKNKFTNGPLRPRDAYILLRDGPVNLARLRFDSLPQENISTLP